MSADAESDPDVEPEKGRLSQDIHTLPRTPEEVDGEVCWVAYGRTGSYAKIHFTDDDVDDSEVAPEKPDQICQHLVGARKAVPRSREKMEDELERELCKDCAGEQADRTQTERTCLKCGGKFGNLAHHMVTCDGELDDTGTDTPEPGKGTGTPWPTPTPTPTRERDTGPNGDGPENEDKVRDSESRRLICEREGCEKPQGKNLRYCSRECSHQSLRDRVKIVCDWCNETKWVPTSRADHQFCSHACANQSKRDRVEITCEWCGGTKEVRASRAGQRFCNRKCLNGHTQFVAPYRFLLGVAPE